MTEQKGQPIIALDFPRGEKALKFLEAFDEPVYVKVGMELFYAEGPEIIKEIKARGHRVFLDLKLHDIPNTVKSAMKVLAGSGVDMVNVHAAGGTAMLKAAAEGLEEGAREAGKAERPLLIAVTQLTSTDNRVMNEEILIPGPLEDVVVKYAKTARDAGLDGVVCSALEAPLIHGKVGEDFLTVTPGIRLAGDAKGDQSRVVTPGKARELGTDYMVIGRSITRAEDPAEAYRRCTE